MVKKTATALAKVAYLLFLLLLAEAGSRAYWTLGKGVPFWRPGEILYFFYPGLEEAAKEETPPGSEIFRVLLLGGSVLDDDHGAVGPALGSELEARLGRPVAIRNVSEAGHTTLDSLHKYRRLEGRRFDLVVVYHGINEARANNISAEGFREDYGHYSWYARINALEKHPELPVLALPYTLHYGYLALDYRLRPAAHLPRHRLSPESLVHGGETKTAAAFRRNLARILDLARERGETAVLMTFAYYVPDGYSEEAFRAKTLDYGRHLKPIELWGEARNVVAALEAHNRVVAELAAAHPEAVFVDQQALLPKSGEVFDDVCHLTPHGSRLFARNIAEPAATGRGPEPATGGEAPSPR